MTDRMSNERIAELAARLDALRASATTCDLSTAEIAELDNYYECPHCEGSGEVDGHQYINFDGCASNVMFSGIGPEFKANERWFVEISAEWETISIALRQTRADLAQAEATIAERDAENARLRTALTLSSNRLARCVVDHPMNSREAFRISEWENEARAEIAPASAETVSVTIPEGNPDLNLAAWMDIRRQDIGPWADYLIRAVGRLEAEVARLRAGVAAAERKGAEAWQPIETAPHETLVVLGWCENGVWKQEIALASAGERFPNGYSNLWRHGSATHWLPLPLPLPPSMKDGE